MEPHPGIEPSMTWFCRPPDSPASSCGVEMAEEVGFEPTEPFDPTVFKTVAINRSATPPKNKKPGLDSAGFESRARTFIQHQPCGREQNETDDVALRMELL